MEDIGILTWQKIKKKAKKRSIKKNIKRQKIDIYFLQYKDE